MSGYLDNNGATPSTATLTLPASIAGTGSTPYNLVIYTAGDTAGRYGTSTVNGGTPITLTEGSQNGGTFVECTPSATAGSAAAEGNYYEFTGLTGTTLTISNLGTNSGTPRLPLDGFQVFSAPEPASMAVLGIAGRWFSSFGAFVRPVTQRGLEPSGRQAMVEATHVSQFPS